MASNGSTSVQVTAYDTLKFNWAQVSQSTANNYTVINWNLQLISGSAGKIISSVPKAWSVKVNGETYSGTTSIAIENSTSKTLASGQTVITHNQDGTKSFSYSFSQEFGITFAGASIGTSTGSGTGGLNTIPRATTPVLNVSSADMGATVTIYTTRASENFTHDLAYSFAGGAFVTIGTGITTSMYWEVPLNLANSIPNATNGTVTIRCITKNGNTTVGTKTALLTAKVPATVIPSISSITHTEANTGTITGIGAYVQSKSRVKVTIAASGTYGSTIKSYSSTFLGKTYTGASFTTDELASGGTRTIITTVTDSRGRTATRTATLSVLNYEAPKITTFHVARYNASGVAKEDGEYAWLKIAYSVTSLNSKNTASAKIEYKKTTDSTWSTLYTRTELSLNTTLKPTSTTFSTDYQWDFKITLTDAFKSESSYETYIPSGAVIFDIKADGKGIAFFKTSTKDGVDIDGALPDSPINLTTNTNLNNLTTPGFYVIPTTTISATITNKPYTDSATASIRVERTGNTSVKQILQKSTKDNGVIYERGYDSSGWGAWSMVYSGAGKLLWSGTLPLTDTQTITLSEAISAQQSGIVVVFNPYNPSTGAALTYGFNCHFIPKQLVASVVPSINSVLGVLVTMAEGKFASNATKFLRITDTTINGSADNTAAGTANGITYNNNRFALRYVIGV